MTRYRATGDYSATGKYIALFKFDSMQAYKDYAASPERAASVEDRKKTFEDGDFEVKWRGVWEPIKTWKR